MLENVMSMIGQAIGNAVIWLDDMLVSLDGVGAFFLVGFFIYTFTRLIIKPLVGSAGSDKAKKPNEKDNKKDE